MQDKVNSGRKSQTLFTQDEVNSMLKKRLKREQKKIDQKVEKKILEKDFFEIIQREKIPISLLEIVISDKNVKQSREALEKLVNIWNGDVTNIMRERKIDYE